MRDGSSYQRLDEYQQKALGHVINGTNTPENLHVLKQGFYVDHAKKPLHRNVKIGDLKKELYGDRYTPLTISAEPREVKVLPARKLDGRQRRDRLAGNTCVSASSHRLR